MSHSIYYLVLVIAWVAMRFGINSTGVALEMGINLAS